MTYGVFESYTASTETQKEQRRADDRKVREAILAAKKQFGKFLAASSSRQEFEERYRYLGNAVPSLVAQYAFPKPAVLRQVKSALRPDFSAAKTASWQRDPSSGVYRMSGVTNPACPTCSAKFASEGLNRCACGSVWNTWTVKRGEAAVYFCREVEERDVKLAARKVTRKRATRKTAMRWNQQGDYDTGRDDRFGARLYDGDIVEDMADGTKYLVAIDGLIPVNDPSQFVLWQEILDEMTAFPELSYITTVPEEWNGDGLELFAKMTVRAASRFTPEELANMSLNELHDLVDQLDYEMDTFDYDGADWGGSSNNDTYRSVQDEINRRTSKKTADRAVEDKNDDGAITDADVPDAGVRPEVGVEDQAWEDGMLDGVKKDLLELAEQEASEEVVNGGDLNDAVAPLQDVIELVDAIIEDEAAENDEPAFDDEAVDEGIDQLESAVARLKTYKASRKVRSMTTHQAFLAGVESAAGPAASNPFKQGSSKAKSWYEGWASQQKTADRTDEKLFIAGWRTAFAGLELSASAPKSFVEGYVAATNKLAYGERPGPETYDGTEKPDVNPALDDTVDDDPGTDTTEELRDETADQIDGDNSTAKDPSSFTNHDGMPPEKGD